MKSWIIAILILSIIILSGCTRAKFGEPIPCSKIENSICKTECGENEVRHINGVCDEPYPKQSCCIIQ